MSDILQLPSGYLSPVGDFARHNTQTLGGVSHLWQDFFARAMADIKTLPAERLRVAARDSAQIYSTFAMAARTRASLSARATAACGGRCS